MRLFFLRKRQIKKVLVEKELYDSISWHIAIWNPKTFGQVEAFSGRHHWFFGLSKVVPDATLLKTFCGTLKYAASEVFLGLSDGHEFKVDVWFLGVIILEWIYDLSTLSDSSQPKRKQETITTSQWYDCVADWTTLLLKRLKDEDEDQLIEILFHIIKVKARKRWPTNKCLKLRFENDLFKRRRVDGLVVCMNDSYDPIVSVEKGNEGTQTPTVTSSLVRASSHNQWSAFILKSSSYWVRKTKIHQKNTEHALATKFQKENEAGKKRAENN
jgi:serine/threonine protein kinase